MGTQVACLAVAAAMVEGPGTVGAVAKATKATGPAGVARAAGPTAEAPGVAETQSDKAVIPAPWMVGAVALAIASTPAAEEMVGAAAAAEASSEAAAVPGAAEEAAGVAEVGAAAGAPGGAGSRRLPSGT